MDNYRAQLLKAVSDLGAAEARRTPEAELKRMVIAGLGLPDGTVLNDEQWAMVLNASAPQGGLSND